MKLLIILLLTSGCGYVAEHEVEHQHEVTNVELELAKCQVRADTYKDALITAQELYLRYKFQMVKACINIQIDAELQKALNYEELNTLLIGK